MDIEFQTHGTFPHGDLLDDRACSDDVNTAQVYGFLYVIRTVGDLFELTGKSVRRSGEPHLFGKHSGRCALLVGKKILGRPDCINSRIVRGSREVEQDTASNTPAQKAAAVMWDLRYLFIIQLFISCFNR